MFEDHICSCEHPGFCEKFKRDVTDRELKICKGVAGIPESSRCSRLLSWEQALRKIEPPKRVSKAGSVTLNKNEKRRYSFYRPPWSKPYKPVKRVFDVEPLRHCIFHISPLAGEYRWVWEKAVNNLLSNLKNFNGSKLVTVSLGSHGKGRLTVPLSEVESLFTGSGVTLIPFDNSERLREVVGFRLALQRLNKLCKDSDDICFVGHTKGVTHGDNKESLCHSWSDVMWKTVACLPEEAKSRLTTKGSCGSFRRVGQFQTPRNARWHYSGTFYWLRTSVIFDRQWDYVDDFFAGMESYPASHMSLSESSCLFYDNAPDLYKADWSKINYDCEKWLDSLEK